MSHGKTSSISILLILNKKRKREAILLYSINKQDDPQHSIFALKLC